MRLTFIGTSHGVPEPHRRCSSYLLETGGKYYVIDKGIPSDRLRYKGYGESQPIADNNTAMGRAKNRRTVFLIYEK